MKKLIVEFDDEEIEENQILLAVKSMVDEFSWVKKVYVEGGD